MSGFPRVPLGDLVLDERPKRSSTNTVIWNLNLDQVESGTGRVLDRVRVRSSELGPSTYPFEAGTVLYSKLRPYLNKVVVADEPGYATTELVPLRCDKDKVLPAYLAYFLRSTEFLNFASTVVAGAKMPRMVMSEFWKYEAPLLPLVEQRRIVAILDKADTLRTKRREALSHLDRLAQSIFVEMFGDPAAHDQRPLEELCELITDGTHQTPTYANEGVIFLSAKNVTSGEIDWGDIKFIPRSLHVELHRRLAPRRGDILLAKNGTTGVAAIVDRDEVFDIYVSLALLRPKLKVLPQYLHAAVNSASCKRQFSGALKGIGVPNLHLKDIRQATVPLPAIAAQEKFVARVLRLSALKADARRALASTDALLAGLQARAFQGAL